MSLTLFGVLGLTLLLAAARRERTVERQPVPIRVEPIRADRRPRH